MADRQKKKSKARISAEIKMLELDELRSKMEEAWRAYFALRVAYEDRLQFIAVYHQRQIVSFDEYEKYKIRAVTKTELSEAVKIYRKARRAGVVK